MLQSTDESIRSRWATQFMATLAGNQVDRPTFSEVITESVSFVAGLWLWQYQPSSPPATSGASASSGKGAQKSTKNNKGASSPVKPNKGQGKGRGNGKGKGFLQSKDRNGKQICAAYNDGRECAFGITCRNLH
eukprot:3841088-Karenia_brevis.AAC.1